MTKKVPMRMCVACREMKPKRDMIRIVLPKEGEMDIDPTGRAHGRGAYICPTRACLELAQKSKKVRIPSTVLEQVEKEIDARGV